MGFLLLGGSGETRETVQQSLDFVDAMQPDSLEVTVGIRIYPDTPLSKYAAEKRVIAPDDECNSWLLVYGSHSFLITGI
ncbi:MAG: hypothetical protein DRH24_08130 [Deltaproteobacteria bacterium]|nr:MAG: hypothetical protein DRH24_08130 [Deltaproteobacteria bacterium]